MRKRFTMALAAGALAAAMLPGVASADWVTPPAAKVDVWVGEVPTDLVCLNFPIFAPVVDPRTGIQYVDRCYALLDGVTVVRRVNIYSEGPGE